MPSNNDNDKDAADSSSSNDGYDDFAEDLQDVADNGKKDADGINGIKDIQNHYEMPFEDLKKSFLQFSSDISKKKPTKTKKAKKVKTNHEEETSGSKSRDELTQGLQSFQAAMNAKLQTKPTAGQHVDDSNTTGSVSSRNIMSDTDESSHGASESSLVADGGLSRFPYVVPKSMRKDPLKDVGVDASGLDEEEPSESNDDDNQGQLNSLSNDEASEDGLEPLQEDEEEEEEEGEAKEQEASAPTHKEEAAFKEQEDHMDDHSEDDSEFEEPLAGEAPPSNRKETLDDLKKFHRTLSSQNLAFDSEKKVVKKRDSNTSSGRSDDSVASLEPPPKPASSNGMNIMDGGGIAPAKTMPSKRERASELRRKTAETPKDDLISSLKAFQTQFDQKLKGSTHNPTSAAGSDRIRQKAPARGRQPSRHKSVEVEHAPLAPEIAKSTRRGSMMAMAKQDSKRGKLKAAKSADGHELIGGNGDKLSTKEIEDRNFRKWFESKMEARVGDNDERFILEEDDHEEGVVDEKAHHGPLVVNVLHSEVSPPEIPSGDSTPAANTPTGIDEGSKHKEPTITSLAKAKWDRASQIKEKNTQMSRDEIKASLLSFQAQLNTTKTGTKIPKKTTDAISGEFRLPPAAPVRVHQAKDRLSQIETRNESLSRSELTASLLAFQSKITKKVSKDGGSVSSSQDGSKKQEAKAKAMEPAKPLKAKEEIAENNNIRRAKGKDGRLKVLEEEQATIPRNVMLASLQKFQADIQGKLNTSQISLDSPARNSAAKKKISKVENFDATTPDDASMEVTEGDYLDKVLGETTPSSADGPKKTKQLETSAAAEASNKAQDVSREEMMKNLLSFQSDIHGKISKKKPVGGKAVPGAGLSAVTRETASVEDKVAPKVTTSEDMTHPRKFESMLKNLEDLKKRNEEKVSTMQNLDRMRKRNEEKVSAMISAISPEDATEMPPWFAEFAQQQEDKFQELVQISEQRNKEIIRLSNDSTRSQVRSLSNQIDETKGSFSQSNSLKRHEKEQRNIPASSVHDEPGQFMGYPESQGSATETSDASVAFEEASYFIQRFSQETRLLNGKRLQERLEEVKNSIAETGSYAHTYDELQYGCRLAWRNCGQFIMRSAFSALTVRDCRQSKTADDCFHQCVKHLKQVFDGGSGSPVVSVFQPKEDSELAPVRLWNRELLGYAAYKREDGSILGDSSNLDFTALCVKFGWIPPEEKSDFDVLPLLISDAARGHDEPKVFTIPPDAIHEVVFDHPDFDLFKSLNLQWYAQASDASMAIEIGGVLYQTAPFTRVYQASEISSFLLDGSRYSFAEVIAAACALRKSHLSLWRDDVQLKTQKAILKSFSRNGLQCLDYHAVSDEFVEFYSSQVQEFGRCPADWVKVVAPTSSSMAGAYHQEMTNYVVKPRYFDQKPFWEDFDLTMPEPLTIKSTKRRSDLVFQKDNCQYDHVYVYYASETGTSLRLATLLVGNFGGSATGPIPLDSLPDLLLESVEKRSLAIVITSTASSGAPPLHAKNFLGGMRQVPKGSLHNIDFALCGLFNAAYTTSLASFAAVVEANLKRAGCVPVMGIHYADTLENPEARFTDFRKKLLDEAEGIVYKRNPAVEPTEPKGAQLVAVSFENRVPVLKLDSIGDPHAAGGGSYPDPWERNSNKLKRSLDLFRFKLEGEVAENQLNGLAAGDHMILYPHNMDDVVETVLRHVTVPDAGITKDYLKKYKDLSKPLSFDELSFLNDYIQGNERAIKVLDELLTNASGHSTLSVEELVQIMPPGSIPMKWIMKYTSSMSPRFYSIASIDERKKTVSIVQSVYTFEGSGKAGVASRWLRSLTKGQKVDATFTTTSFRLPDDEGAPIVLISSGPGIAPCRTFWLSGRTNPTYLFCGCKSPEELPYSTEIELLKKKGLLHPFVAYSNSNGRKIELEGLLRQERATLLDLLHNSRTRLYVCGSPEVDAKVRNSLAMILAQGHSRHQGLGMAKAMERLALMSQSKMYVREVYGNAVGDAARSDPMYALWQESTVKVVRALAELEKLQAPIAPTPPRQNGR